MEIRDKLKLMDEMEKRNDARVRAFLAAAANKEATPDTEG